MSRLAAGERINDRYVVVDHLGGGANGEVYEVYDEHLDNRVALKLMTPRAGQQQTWDEAHRLEQLRSKFLLPVFNADIVQGSDVRFITSPVMRGGDLAVAASSHGVSPTQAARWGQQLAHGLDRVHAAGLVHRDVKPENAFLDVAGDLLLGDLGMAAILDGSGRAAADGTWATAAPEVLAGARHTSIATDLYSAGATAFYLLTGRYPVEVGLPQSQFIDAVTSGRRRRLRDLAPHVSISLARVVDRALAIDPAERQPSALVFANELAAARHHPREWRLIPPHPDHLICLQGGPKGAAQGVSVCAAASGRQFNIEIVAAGGQHQRRHELSSVPRSRVLVELRRLAADV